jgi:hypothetical protein
VILTRTLSRRPALPVEDSRQLGLAVLDRLVPQIAAVKLDRSKATSVTAASRRR